MVKISRIFVRLGMAAVLAGLPASSMAQEVGEPSDGKSPPGSAVHLTRSEETPEQPWRHQLYQNGVDLKPGDEYTLTFWARASGEFPFHTSSKLDKPPWVFTGLRNDVLLTTEWRKYSVTFPAKDTEPEHTRITFNYGSRAPGEVWIADVRLRPADAAEDSSVNLIANPQFEDGLDKWSSEGRQPGIYSVEVQPMADAESAAKK